ncbi:hypothetical protein AMECASPLE_011209 [Ameca splendens]|uniref:Secreted protein n=1 Tax=Ameca splendens TaxID=208324 RepID=A0ABV0YBN2_9TELE
MQPRITTKLMPAAHRAACVAAWLASCGDAADCCARTSQILHKTWTGTQSAAREPDPCRRNHKVLLGSFYSKNTMQCQDSKP